MSRDLFTSSAIDRFPGAADSVLVAIARASGVADTHLRDSFRTHQVLAAGPRQLVNPQWNASFAGIYFPPSLHSNPVS